MTTPASTSTLTRRGFLGDSSRVAGAGWLALQLPWIAALAGCVADVEKLVHFTPAEGRTMRTLATRILPSGDGPGAEEAGVVHFIDRALGTPFFADEAPLIHRGLADLDARASALGALGGFQALSEEQQISVIRHIEHDAFFASVRTLVVIGMFAEPSYGGNRNGIGWTMIGMQHRPSYSAPYGWYDAQLGVVAEQHAG